MQLTYSLYANQTGYSISAQDYLLAMMRVNPSADIRVEYINRQIGLGISSDRTQILTALNKKSSSEPSISLFHCIPPRYRRPSGPTKHIGLCVFETINVPNDWVESMNNMDMIITASQFNKHIFINAGVTKPVHVIPHCFDPNLFNADVRPLGRYDPTTFISVGAWKNRKNWETLIKAWYQAFEQKNDVCLLIKTDKPDLLKQSVIHIKRTSEWRTKSTAPIYCEENPICHFEEIPKIMKKGDIYISTSLGEGFGISGLHAMALGMPVITTRFGGVLEYAKPELCTYLNPEKYNKIPVMDAIPQLSNCIWPQLSIGEVVDKMHYVLQNKNEVNKKTQAAYKFVHDNFAYKAIGKQFLNILELTDASIS